MKIKDICPVCGQKTTESDDLTVRFDKGDYEVIIHHVPGRKCANCGEQVFSRETVKRLQEIMRSHPAMSKRRIETDFAA